MLVDVDAIRARVRAVSPGRWERRGGDVHVGDERVPLFVGRAPNGTAGGQPEADAEFVAHAPQDVAALLVELAVLRTEAAHWRLVAQAATAGRGRSRGGPHPPDPG